MHRTRRGAQPYRSARYRVNDPHRRHELGCPSYALMPLMRRPSSRVISRSSVRRLMDWRLS